MPPSSRPRKPREPKVGRAAGTSPPAYFDLLAADHATRSGRAPHEPWPLPPPPPPLDSLPDDEQRRRLGLSLGQED